jgi:hypothetical protein
MLYDSPLQAGDGTLPGKYTKEDLFERLCLLSERLNSSELEPPAEWKSFLEPFVKNANEGEAINPRMVTDQLSDWLKQL